jgi:Type I phosphodiesterase / nucleotide pyrophosphatase
MSPAKLRLVLVTLACFLTLGGCLGGVVRPESSATNFSNLACTLPGHLLTIVQRGRVAGRSGDIALIPRTPAYMTDRGGGWPHSGPWPYLQKIPLVFYGPGLIPALGPVDGPATLADVAPTLARLLGTSLPTAEGKVLAAVASGTSTSRPKLVITIVWDGGGRNVLERWPDSWPNLASLARAGVSYEDAVVGSSPSVTPAAHTTLGTGAYPRTHGVPLITMRGADGKLGDSFGDGTSSASIRVPALAETWDESHGGEALVAMVGYQPWHLGMIGKGAERPGADRDHAVWLDESGRWVTNEGHYSMPVNFGSRDRIGLLVRELDSEDGRLDGSWGERNPLDDSSKLDDTPAFARYHARELIEMIDQQGYGEDGVTDLIFTNFKQIDRIGHKFNMTSEEVRRSVEAADESLGELVAYLSARFDRGDYAVLVTADHGQQSDADDVRGYSIDPAEVARDIDSRFGPITESVLPTEVFLDHSRLKRRAVAVDQVAGFLADYRLQDNLKGGRARNADDPILSPDDRLFALAIPGEKLESLSCQHRRAPRPVPART